MKFYRIWALIERDLRKFFRSPALMMASMVFPLVQLIVLGYAFGGKIKGATIAFVDEDHSVESRRVREMFVGISAGAQTFRVEDYGSLPRAVDDLRAGFVRGVIDVPLDFSRRYYQRDRPRIAFTEDNTDQVMASALLERIQQMVSRSLKRADVAASPRSQVQLNVVEVYPYCGIRQILPAGSTAMAIFLVADDRRRNHLHRRQVPGPARRLPADAH